MYIRHITAISGLSFSWDEEKAAANAEKHNVTFDEAASAFYDDYARVIDDPKHSLDEDRFVLLGMSKLARMLVVCHCYRSEDVRIISARRATKHEEQSYWRHYHG